MFLLWQSNSKSLHILHMLPPLTERRLILTTKKEHILWKLLSLFVCVHPLYESLVGKDVLWIQVDFNKCVGLEHLLLAMER